MMPFVGAMGFLIALALTSTLGASPAHAACNLIPSATQTFRGTLGVLDRPFASPAEFVEIRGGACTGPAPLFPTTDPDDYAVTLVFTPPSGGPRHVLVLATDCTGIADCAGAIDTECRVAGMSDLSIVARDGANRLRFRFPDTDDLADVLDDNVDDDRTLSGPVRIAVSSRASGAACGLVADSCAEQAGLRACVDEFYRLDGSCRSLVDTTFGHFTALPPPNRYAEICIEPAFPSGPCLGTANEVRFTTDAAGNVLIPVDWQGILVRAANVPVPRLLRAGSSIEAFGAATDPIDIPSQTFVASYTPEGAILPPIFLPQVDPTAENEVTFFGSADAPHTVLRLGRKSPTAEACVGGNDEGRPCAADTHCNGGLCEQAVCNGGPAAGQACDDDQFDCPNSECGSGLFEFRDRYASGRGPVLIPRFATPGDQGVCEAGNEAGGVCSDTLPCDGGAGCVDYRSVAQNPVPLEGLVGTEDVFAFAVSEPIANDDLNGDGDIADVVLTIQDRGSGGILSIGSAGAPGRAVATLREPPFQFPALATEGDLVAFLEPEVREGTLGTRDKNSDGDEADTVLRVYHRASSTNATEVTASFPVIAADAGGALDGRSIQVSGGRTFFRAPEWAGAPYTTTRISTAPGGADADGASFYPAMSADGRLVAYSTFASNLFVPADSNNNCDPSGLGAGSSRCIDVVLYDRESGTHERISVTSGGIEGSGWSYGPSISDDGRFVAFRTAASNLPPAGAGWVRPVLRDRTTPTTEQLDVSTGGTAASDVSDTYPMVSATGRYVGFTSLAQNLDGPAGDPNVSSVFFTNPKGLYTADAYVRDRIAPETDAVSIAPDGVTLSGGGNGATPGNRVSVSADGRYAAFVAEADNLAPVPYVGTYAFLHDRFEGTTTVISRAHDGFVANAYWPQITADGSLVSGHCPFHGVVPEDVNNFCNADGVGNGVTNCYDVYMFGRDGRRPELVSVSSEGVQGNGASAQQTMSSDGRFVVFWSEATNLVPGDGNGVADIFLRDRLTGVTQRVSVSAGGGVADADSGWRSGTAIGYAGGWVTADVSDDGRIAVFASEASNLVADDSNGTADMFVREPDPIATATHDRTGDGDLDDAVLEVISATPSPVRTPLCPSAAAAVTDGRVAFLRPEAAGNTPAIAACPNGTSVAGGVDLNGDSDAADHVVQLWTGSGTVQSLGLGATAVALSSTHVAAISGTAQIHPIAGGSWTDTGEPAATIGFCGTVLAFIRPDGELGLHDPASGQTLLTGQQAEEFVCNENQIALRTSEAAQGETLNGDNDQLDDVLQVWDLTRSACVSTTPPADCRANSGYAVRPCRLEACDPRIPYRVGQDSVRFLTYECDEGGSVTAGCAGGGTDLNGNTPPYAGDLVIQSFNVRTRVTTPIGTVIAGDTQSPLPPDPPAATGAGEQIVFNSTGRCVEVIGGVCGTDGDCARGEFCETGVCKRDQGVCVSDADCPPASICTDDPIVAASPDTDADGVPEHLDNCPLAANADQTDGDQDGVGDACDSLCAGSGDPDDKVKIKTTNDGGMLSAKLIVPLGAYDGQAIAVRLDDTDSVPIAWSSVATLLPLGSSGKKWSYKSNSDGLRAVTLVDLSPERPGDFEVQVKTKRWFTAAQANRPAADTTVGVVIGSWCYTAGVTTKLD